MRSIIVLSCVVVLTCWVKARPARGQASAIEVEVQSSAAPADTCLTSQQLSARVAHYSSPKARPSGLRLVLYITGTDAAELHILRAGNVVSRRTFTQLPTPCADRRDAVALSIALALERTAAERPRATASDSTSRNDKRSAANGGERPSGKPAAPTPAIDMQSVQSDATSTLSDDKAPLEDTANGDPSNESSTNDASASTNPTPPEPSPATATATDPPNTYDNIPSITSHDPRKQTQSPLQLHLGGRLTLEAVPTPVWVAALGVELPISTTLTLGITALMSTVGEAALAGARARANFLGLEAVGCGNIALGAFMLQACGGAAVALCEVSGRDFPRERPEATLLWAAVLGRATVRWPREGFIAARLLLQPHVSISRPDLRVEDASEHLSTFWIGGTAGLELWLAL